MQGQVLLDHLLVEGLNLGQNMIYVCMIYKILEMGYYRCSSIWEIVLFTVELSVQRTSF